MSLNSYFQSIETNITSLYTLYLIENTPKYPVERSGVRDQLAIMPESWRNACLKLKSRSLLSNSFEGNKLPNIYIGKTAIRFTIRKRNNFSTPQLRPDTHI